MAHRSDKLIFTTTDLKQFKRLRGNRTVLNQRVEKIMQSIKKVGYVPNPIIVNEKLEVIDGQGRLEALKRLCLPVDYIVVPGIGGEECIALNIYQENWKLIDYISFYAEEGREPYILLYKLLKDYSHKLRIPVIITAFTRKMDINERMIKSGNFVASSEDYAKAQILCSWLIDNFYKVLKRVGGNTVKYYQAICFCYDHPGVDNERLEQKMFDRQADLIPVSTLDQALDEVEKIYNHKIRTGNKVYITNDYKKLMDGKYAWYSVLHGNKKTR